MKEQLVSEIITTDDGINSPINHNVNPPRPETTGHYWRMKVVAQNRTNNTIDLEEFTR